jgi:hypothetical protein
LLERETVSPSGRGGRGRTDVVKEHIVRVLQARCVPMMLATRA